jgi:hypothetical protein
MAYKARDAQLLFGLQVSDGTDPGLVGANAVSTVDDLFVTPEFETFTPRENRGGYGRGESIVGAVTARIPWRSYLRGSGTPATPPEWAELLRAGSFAETIRAAPLPASGTQAVSAGTANTVTFVNNAGTGTQWPNTTGSLVGEVIEIAGDPVGPIYATIESYVVTGTNTVITFTRSHPTSVFTTSTTIKKINQYILTPASPQTVARGYAHVNNNGIRTRVSDINTDPTITLVTGASNLSSIGGTMTGKIVDEAAFAMPTGVFDAPSPPIWRGQDAGGLWFNRVAQPVSQISVSLGGQTTFPEDPAATDGRQATEFIERAVTFQMDPLLLDPAVQNLMNLARNNTIGPILALIGDDVGNRFALTIVRGKLLGVQPTNRNGVIRKTVNGEGADVNSEVHLVQY